VSKSWPTTRRIWAGFLMGIPKSEIDGRVFAFTLHFHTDNNRTDTTTSMADTSQSLEGKSVLIAEDLPIIALTAEALDDTRDEVSATEMNDFIVKPIAAEELTSKVSALT